MTLLLPACLAGGAGQQCSAAKGTGSRQLNEPGLITAAAPGETQALLGSGAPGEVSCWQLECSKAAVGQHQLL